MDNNILKQSEVLNGVLNGSIDINNKIEPETSEGFKLGFDKSTAWVRTFKNETFIGRAFEDNVEDKVNFDKYAKDELFDDKAKEQLWNEWGLATTIHDRYKDTILSKAKSEEHLSAMLPHFYIKSAEERSMENKGFWDNMLMGAVSEIANIPFYLPQARVASLVAQGGMSKMRQGVIGGVSEFAMQMIHSSYGERERYLAESIASSVFAGGLTGVLAKQGNNIPTDEIDDVAVQQAKLNIENLLGITPETKKKFYNATTDEEKKSIIEESISNSPIMNPIQTSKQGKEATVDKFVQYKKQLEEAHNRGEISKSTFRAISQDFEYLTKTSESDNIRLLGDRAFIDGSLANNKTDTVTLLESKDLYQAQAESQFTKYTAPLERELEKILPFSISNSLTPSFINNSSELVSKAIGTIGVIRDSKVGSDEYAVSKVVEMLRREGIDEVQANTFANKALQAQKNISKEHGIRNVKFGMKDFVDEETVRDDYFTNVFTHKGLDNLASKGLGFSDAVDYFTNAHLSLVNKRNEKIRASNIKKQEANALEPDTTKHKPLREEKVYTPEQLQTLKTAMSKLVNKIGVQQHNLIGANSSNSNLFKEALQEAGMSDKDIADILGSNKRTGSVYTRTRMPIDRSYVHRVGTDGKVDITDFLSTDAYAVNNSYIRKMSGRQALEKFEFGVMYKDEQGIENLNMFDLGSDEGINRFIELVNKELTTKINEGKISSRKAKAEMTRLMHILNHFNGTPVTKDPDNILHKLLMISKNLNLFRLMGKIILPMTAELHNVTAYNGFKNMFDSMGNMGVLKSYHTTGKIDNAFIDEARDMLGLTHEYFAGSRASIYEQEFDTGTYKQVKSWVDKALDKGTKMSEKMAEFTMMLGGMKPFTAGLQIAHYTGLVKRFKELGKEPIIGMKNKQLFREMGISDAMAERIHKQIKKHGISVRGKDTLGLKNWDDNEASMMFRIGIKRSIDNVVQRPTLGNDLAVTMGDEVFQSTALGKYMLELKKYMYQSYVKQFMKMTNSDTAFHYLSAMSQMGVLAGLYVAEQYMYHGNDVTTLNKKLTPEQIANGTISRMSISGMPMMLLGTGSRATVGQNVFSTEGSGYHKPIDALISSSPTTDLGNRLLNVIPSITSGDAEKMYYNTKGLAPNLLPLEVAKKRLIEND